MTEAPKQASDMTHESRGAVVQAPPSSISFAAIMDANGMIPEASVSVIASRAPEGGYTNAFDPTRRVGKMTGASFGSGIAVGDRVYHRKQKIEGTVAEVEGGKIEVRAHGKTVRWNVSAVVKL